MVNNLYLCTPIGEMLEWLKRHAWKACNRPKRFRGSNPRLSAEDKKTSPTPSQGGESRSSPLGGDKSGVHIGM